MRIDNHLLLLIGSAIRLIFWICGAVSPILAQQAVSGRVADENGIAISRVQIVLENVKDSAISFRTITDRQGRYAFDEVPDGEYWLEASRPGFVSVRLTPIVVNFPLRSKKDFVLAVAPGDEGGIQIQTEVVGVLKQAGHRLSHVKVCLLQGSMARCTETNGIGQYYLAIQPGSYDVVVSVNGNTLWKGRLDLPLVGPYRDKIQLDAQQ